MHKIRQSGVRRRAFTLTAVACAAAAMTAMLPSGTAHAAAGSSASTCMRTSASDTYSTYVASEVKTDRGTSSSSQKVQLNTWAYARSFDCGPRGAAYSVPALKVVIEWAVSGSSVNCGASVSGGTSGAELGFNCANNKSEMTVTESTTCANQSSCRIAFTPVVFTAGNGGSIDRVVAKVNATISGPQGSTSTQSSAIAFPYS